MNNLFCMNKLSIMVKDRAGQVFGRLTVQDNYYVKNRKTYWLCACECGVNKHIDGNALQSGATISCGCYHREAISKSSKKHGHWAHPLYWVHRGMLNRCNLKSDRAYVNYGARGISVCDEWRKDFKSFYDWAIANGWAIGLEIDRINNDGNYEPSNCRFVTRKVNSNNKRDSTFVTLNGIKYSMDELEKISGIPAARISHRINHNKWSVEKAISEPVAARPPYKKKKVA